MRNIMIVAFFILLYVAFIVITNLFIWADEGSEAILFRVFSIENVLTSVLYFFLFSIALSIIFFLNRKIGVNVGKNSIVFHSVVAVLAIILSLFLSNLMVKVFPFVDEKYLPIVFSGDYVKRDLWVVIFVLGLVVFSILVRRLLSDEKNDKE